MVCAEAPIFNQRAENDQSVGQHLGPRGTVIFAGQISGPHCDQKIGLKKRQRAGFAKGLRLFFGLLLILGCYRWFLERDTELFRLSVLGNFFL